MRAHFRHSSASAAPWLGARVCVAACVALAALTAAHPAGAATARLEVRGRVLGARECAGWFAPALRAPRDSAALSVALGAAVQELESRGHLDARASAAWDTTDGPRLLVRFEEGPRYTLSSIVLETPGAEDSARIARALHLVPGGPASPVAVGAAIGRAVEALSGDGYPYVTLGVRLWQADSARVSVHLSGALGPHVTVTAVRIDGLHATRPDVATRAVGPLVGHPYDRAAAEDGRDRLEALGLFRTVAFEGLEGEPDWHGARLVYKVEEPRYNEFEGAVGVQGAAGAVGLARLDLGNLLGTGRAVALRWESRGSGVTQFDARYGEPQVFGLPLRLEGNVAQEVQDTLYVRTRWGVHGVFALSGRERIEAGYDVERVVQEFDVVQEADLENTMLALEHSSLDPAGRIRQGWMGRLAVAQSYKREHLRPEGEQTARASEVELHGAWRTLLRGASALNWEVSSGGRFSSEAVLPQYERTPLGGAKTLRGYDEQQFWVDRYALSRLEWGRYLGEGAQRAYLFWDHAWTSTRDQLADGRQPLTLASHDGIGFGLRVETGGGLIGLDYGLEPGRPPLEGKLHLQLVSQF
jgi:outer membrane protein assembly factor BamA